MLDFDLKPTLSQREALGALIKVPVFDEDEIVVDPAANVAIAPIATDADPVLEYALGAGRVEQTTGQLVLDDLRQSARVAGSLPIDCRPGTPVKKGKVAACKPFVRIWYVDPPESLPAAAVDPAVAERLRALEYAW